jgi:hypothetical protein
MRSTTTGIAFERVLESITIDAREGHGEVASAPPVKGYDVDVLRLDS